MKIISLFVAALLGFPIVSAARGAELRKPERPSPSDALFDPDRYLLEFNAEVLD